MYIKGGGMNLDEVVNNGVPFVNLYDSKKFNKASLYLVKKRNKYSTNDQFYFVYHNENGSPIYCCSVNHKYPRLVIKNWDKKNIDYEILNKNAFIKWKRSKDTGPKYTSPVSPVNGLETEIRSS